MTKNYRPEVAYPTHLAQAGQHFASGVNDPGELRGLALSGRHFGITASLASESLLAELDLYTHGMQQCFVDSGAFSEVAFPEDGPPVVVKEITDEQWVTRLAIAERIAKTFGRRARVVAPDRVGCQMTTLARMARYGAQVAAIAARGAQIIVPVQKGSMPMSAFYARACQILNLAVAPIAGIPMKKDATSLEQLAELVESLPWFGARIHLLGLGPSATRGKIRFRDVVALIKRIRPNATITSDSVTIRRLVGRSNGKGGSPRALTLAQDQARAAGLTGSAVKQAGLVMQGFQEIDAERIEAEDAGWFDVELYDSVEEARAHRLAGYPDEPTAATPSVKRAEIGQLSFWQAAALAVRSAS
jgi:hypothetical protein